MKIHKLLITVLLCTVTLIGLNLNTNAQTQKGMDIDGENDWDYTGSSVSMPNVNTVAIGASQNDGNGNYAGHVRIYTWNGSAWLQKGNDIDGEAAGDFSGRSVSMPDANTVAIGADENDGNGTDAGHVRIYAWNGSTWVQKGLDIDGEGIYNRSGSSVNMPDANTVAIGASFNDGSGNVSGHVRIYAWNGSLWVQKGFDIDGEAAYDRSGYSVSMPDSNTVAIGAIHNNESGDNAGHVRIFIWNGSAWIQKGLDIDGEWAYDQSGYSVSMPDVNTVGIGAIHNYASGTEAGYVRIYAWNGSVWVQKGLDIDGEALYDQSGYSVSMSDSNTVAIGAHENDGNGDRAGHVRIYAWNGSTWVQKGNDIDGEAAGDFSGYSVSMPDSNTVAIGAPGNDDAGHVRIYSPLCNNTSSSLSPTTCNGYTSPSGNHIWTTTGTFFDTIPNTGGCDSIITVNLTINMVDVSVTNSSPTLTANAIVGTYQWLDCNNAMAVIIGETNQSFTAKTNGSYAVEVRQHGCTDTSDCEAVNNVAIHQNDFGSKLMIYPNPADGNIALDLGSVYKCINVIVRNKLGQEINRLTFGNTSKLQFTLPGEAGIYFIEVNADNKRAILKVIKE